MGHLYQIYLTELGVCFRPGYNGRSFPAPSHSRPPFMSSIVRTVIGYHASTDYNALWELAQRQSVVCLVLYQKEIIDVAQTIAIPNGKGGWSIDISCRGTGYIQGWNRAAFIQQCEKAQVQWLIPQERC